MISLQNEWYSHAAKQRSGCQIFISFCNLRFDKIRTKFKHFLCPYNDMTKSKFRDMCYIHTSEDLRRDYSRAAQPNFDNPLCNTCSKLKIRFEKRAGTFWLQLTGTWNQFQAYPKVEFVSFNNFQILWWKWENSPQRNFPS